MSKESKKSVHEVRAEDLIRELTQDPVKKDIGKDTAEDIGEPLLPLSNAKITGELDLKHRTINTPMIIRNCEFEGGVDFRYCEFKQVVDFSGCTFHKEFNSGDIAQSYTIYRKDFIADRAIFEDAVSFNTAKCEAGVHLNKAEFRNKEKSIDFTGASVDKTLELGNARFAGGANFSFVQCGIAGLFQGARFWNKTQTVDFTGASFKSLFCQGARFNGPVVWNYTKCGNTGLFQNTRFEGKYVTFNLASFGTLDCRYARFHGIVDCNSVKCEGAGLFGAALFAGPSVDFCYTSFGTLLDCTNAIFKADEAFNYLGRVAFENLECKYGIFPGVKFLNPMQEVSFRDASFNVNLNFESKSQEPTAHLELQSKGPAVFNGPISFDRLECKSNGKFGSVRFKDIISGVSFDSASFGTLDCTSAKFKGPASFRSLKCGVDGFFNEAQFEGTAQVNFAYASFGADLQCDGATFQAPASFVRLKCGGSGLFRGTRFESALSTDPNNPSADYIFDLANIGVNLSFTNSCFAGGVSLNGTRILQQLQLIRKDFEGETGFKEQASFRSATMGMLVLDEYFSIARESLDLRECTFERFIGDDSVAERFVRAREPMLATRDPYLQLEKYYRSIGDEVQAKTIYFRGRCHLRESVKYRNKQTKPAGWGNWLRAKPTSWGDWGLKWLTGYGVKTWRLLVPIIAMLLLGIAVFWPGNAMKAVENKPSTSSQILSQDTTSSTQSGTEQSSRGAGAKNQKPRSFDRVAYDLDLFLPLDLGAADKWVPVTQWREIYIVFHSLAGWLLIPLLVASLAGIIRRQ